jgi:SAM-dependent methyltransferase
VTAAYRDPVEFYRDHAAEFDATRSRDLIEKPWLDAFAALLPGSGSVLDAGCGTGDPIAAYMASLGFIVTGIDATDEFLALARKRVPQANFLQGDLRTFDLDRTFDGIIAWDSFFHLSAEDQLDALRRFGHHATRDAVLLFNAGPRRGEAINPLYGEPLYHASLSAEEYRDALNEAGFSIVKHCVEDPNCNGRTVWLAKRQSRK